MFSVTPTLSYALSAGMHDFDNGTLEVILYITAGVILIFLGYRAGRFFASMAASKTIAQKEQELFTAQKGFKNLYEQEMAKLQADNAQLGEQVKTLTARVEEYRK